MSSEPDGGDGRTVVVVEASPWVWVGMVLGLVAFGGCVGWLVKWANP